MGSSYRKHRKSSSSKDKRKKRRHDVYLSDSEDCHSSSDTDSNLLKKRKLSKKTKKISRHSRSFEDRSGHKRKSRSERLSRSVERKKPSKRRRKLSPSSDSSATYSGWNSSSSDEIVHKKSQRSSHRLHQKVKTRRSRYQSCTSRGCSSCSQCTVSSHEKSPPHNNPRVGISKILKEQELPNDHEDVVEAADIIQSNDGYPSSRSNDSNEAVRKGMQELGASTSISRGATKIEASVDVGDSSVSDLEALLRQKALENFAKFRFRRLANEKFISSKNDVSVSSESIQTKAHISSARVTGNLTEGIGVPLAVEGCRDSSTRHSPLVTEDAECAASLKSDEKVLDLISLSKTIPDGTVELSSVGALEVEAVGGAAPQESHSPKPRICNGTSHDTEMAGKSDSELERKTMRVVRGGKLLKVGYKLYIPKKYPALSRRKFQT